MEKQRLTPEQALQKIRHFCAWQERSHYEVREKLYSFGLRSNEVEEIISGLIGDNYLNEERFATLFAGGRFRMKKWGKKKIAAALKQHRVSPYNINIALSAIDEEQYQKNLLALTGAKWNELKKEQYINRQVKTMRYMLQKGYEQALISKAIERIRNKDQE